MLRNATRRFLPLVLLPALAAAADRITFDDHVFPIFEQSCLNCHNPDKAKGGLDLSSYGATLKGGSGGKIVDAGDTGAKLLAVMTHSAEPKMPPEGDKVAADKIALLKQWIEGGLPENKSSGARKPDKPKFDLAMGSSPGDKPDGPPPMPEHLLLEPVITTARGSAVRSIAASPWAPLLAVTGQRQVLLYNTDSFRLAGVLPFPAGDPVSLAFTPDGRYLIAGGGIAGKSGTTVTWDVTDGRVVLRAGREFDSVLAADLRPDFGAVATGSPSRLIKLWNSGDGEMTASIKKHTDWVTALDYTPDGVLLATGDRNGGVWAWEAQTGAEFHSLRGHQARITGLAFRADSNLLASASEDGSVRFWEMNGGNEIRKLDAHKDGVLGFSWARDGSFATIGRDRRIKTWKSDFKLRKEIKLGSALPTAVALSADGARVFVGDYKGEVSAWHAGEGTRLGSMPSNPPTLAARIESIAERIDRHPGEIGAAGRKLAALKEEQRFWQAASVNAEAIGKRADARKLAEQFDSLVSDFSAAANKVEHRRAAVNEVAARRHSFARALARNPADPAFAAELASVLDTLDFRLGQRRSELSRSSRELIDLGRRIDRSAPDRVAADREAASLAARYRELTTRNDKPDPPPDPHK